MIKSQVFLYFCVALIGGFALSSFIFIPQLVMLGILILGILLISVLWEYKKIVIVGFCLLFLVLGIWRYQEAESKIIHPQQNNITFTGIVIKEPDIRTKSQKLTISVHGRFPGLKEGEKILITTNRYPEYRYGDKLKITGKLQIPQAFEDFNYKDYLAKDGIYSVMYWPKIELIEKNQGNPIYAKILSFKNKLRESIYRNLSPPQSSILGAIILGDKRRISEDLKEKLNIVGVRHITAISGMHIMILSGILMYLGMMFGLGRGQAFYFAIILLALYIIMVGLPASAVRAGIMGGLFLLAQKVGRPKAAGRAIVFAATGMLAVNPLLLRLDVGFQLSFLAVMGIIYLMPIFQRWVKIQILAMTLAAQVFTLPILIYNFGYMSLVAPITNILIIPSLPFIMILGFIFGLAGMIFQPLGWILSWPCWLLLGYITKIVDFFSQIPLASLAIEKVHWLWLIIAYLILGSVTWWLNRKVSRIFYLC